jgi:hypothetical protein
MQTKILTSILKREESNLIVIPLMIFEIRFLFLDVFNFATELPTLPIMFLVEIFLSLNSIFWLKNAALFVHIKTFHCNFPHDSNPQHI